MGLSIVYFEWVTGWDFQLMIWALTRLNLTLLHVNNKGRDQPAYLRRLISSFVIHLLEGIIAMLATCKVSKF